MICSSDVVALGEFPPAPLIRKSTVDFSYELIIRTDGYLRFSWSTDGTIVTHIDCLEKLGLDNGEIGALKVEFDLTSSSAAFFESADQGFTWTELIPDLFDRLFKEEF